ncbi:MAG: OmpA family protein [Pseudomonadota bacterium]
MFPHPLFRIGIGALLLSGAPALAEPSTVVIGGSGKPAVTVDMGVLETLDRPTMRRYLLMPGSGPANDGRVELRRPGSLAAGSGTTPPAPEPAESESATLSPPAEPVMAPVETAVPPPPARPVVEIPLTPPPLAQPKIAPPKEVVSAPAPVPAPVPVPAPASVPVPVKPVVETPLTQPKVAPPKEVVSTPAPAPVPVKPVVETPLAQPPLTQPKVAPPKEVVSAPAPAPAPVPVPVKPVVETPLTQPKVAPPKEVVSTPAPAPAPVPVKPVVETPLTPPPPVKLTEPKSFPLPEAKPQTSAAAVPAKRPEQAEEVASLLPPASAFKAGEPLRLAFGSESALLSDTAKIALESFARQLKEKPSLRIQLLAYASGTQETALQARRLSLSRALVVRSHLIEQGISSIRMDVRALGNKAEGEPSDRVDLVIANDE